MFIRVDSSPRDRRAAVIPMRVGALQQIIVEIVLSLILNYGDRTMHPSTLTDTQVFEAYADALKALVTALGWQIDPVRLHRDLQTIASVTRRDGDGASAGLIDELARTVEVRLLTTKVSIERTVIPFR